MSLEKQDMKEDLTEQISPNRQENKMVDTTAITDTEELKERKSYFNTIGNYTCAYFIGIGGIGMSALARYFTSLGFTIGGYDLHESSITKKLESEGITVTYNEGEEDIPEIFKNKTRTLIIITPAIPESNMQLQFFRSNGFCIMKRAEALGMVTRQMRALCVAGTHGKTTTSTMLAHLLYQSDIHCNAFLGGISRNYGTNLLLQPDSNYVVVEADEYDHSFLQLKPYMSIITSVDPDHLDIYGDKQHYIDGFNQYCRQIQSDGTLILKDGIELDVPQGLKTFRYGVKNNNDTNKKLDFFADNIQVKNSQIYFDFHTPSDVYTEIKLGVPVWVNIENAVAAMTMAWLVGIEQSEIRLGIASYAGVNRRFNIHINTPACVYIDDYAHHPTEIKASIESIRMLFPDRHLTVVFQPHLYSRTRDFYKGFAQALSAADDVILLPIYPAREKPIEGISSDIILNDLTGTGEHLICDKEHLLATLQSKSRDIILTLGAGDIDAFVEPIVQAYKPQTYKE